MDDRQKIQHLFQFDLWCNRKLAEKLIAEEDFEQRSACVAFLSHIINAQKIWYNRVIDLEIEATDIWQEYQPDEISSKARKIQVKWLNLIGDHEVNLETVIYYTNSKGVEYQNPLWQICHHLIIHGQHHRAQISLLLRKSGIEPPASDYIFYTRDRA
ncbi:DinB family protein [Rhodohalobacter mucosus]|uniref:Damage-inducible protein DinB n=1 Tax=Rhodohalobacter mucosus TaxID=2079485 RepID=A0A316TY65_9BACT|nr:DinB family protein [Rhodohalobacter mucosus]PWN07752.1 hypothetical protein DDZ15_01655 [Rhodohalobacter mucosus]